MSNVKSCANTISNIKNDTGCLYLLVMALARLEKGIAYLAQTAVEVKPNWANTNIVRLLVHGSMDGWLAGGKTVQFGSLGGGAWLHG